MELSGGYSQRPVTKKDAETRDMAGTVGWDCIYKKLILWLRAATMKSHNIVIT